MPRYSDVTEILERTTVKPTVIERKPRSDRAAVSTPLDEYVEQSYMEGEALELTVPGRFAKDTQRLIRTSVRRLGQERQEDIRVTLKVKERPDGKVTVQFFVRPPYDMGRRAWKTKQDVTGRPRGKKRL